MTWGIGIPRPRATDDFAHCKTREQTEMWTIMRKRSRWIVALPALVFCYAAALRRG